jgi:hypothetical protein
MKTEDTIQGLFEFFRPHLPKNGAVCFNLEVTHNNYGYEKDGKTHHEKWEASLHQQFKVLIVNPNYVFISVNEAYPSSRIPTDADLVWENTSNHDSCWRSDGLRKIFQETYRGHNLVWKNTPDEHRRSMNDSHISETLFPIFSKKIEFFDVQLETDAADKYGYRKRIVALKPLQFEMSFVKL